MTKEKGKSLRKISCTLENIIFKFFFSYLFEKKELEKWEIVFISKKKGEKTEKCEENLTYRMFM